MSEKPRTLGKAGLLSISVDFEPGPYGGTFEVVSAPGDELCDCCGGEECLG